MKGALVSIDAEMSRLEQRHHSVMRFFDCLKRNEQERTVLCLKEETIRARFAQSMDRVLPVLKRNGISVI